MKMKRFPAIYLAISALLIVTLSCNLQSGTPTQDLAAIVAQTQTAIAIEQLLTATNAALQTSISKTNTPIPTTSPPSSIKPSNTATIPTLTLETNCANKAKFEDESIPDNTVFPPGEEFVKTWTLRNVGTCTWTPDYELVYVKGEQMDGTSPVPIGETVPPNDTIRLFLPQTAPQAPGLHEGYWKLISPAGEEFGLGKDADVAFWVKILVEPGASSGTTGGVQGLGAPDYIDSFDGPSSSFDLGADSKISFALQDGNLVMTGIVPDGDLWRVSSAYLDDFYIEAGFKTGPVCSGRDSYGLLVRAPDQPDSIIDSGYVFSFSCEGRYRIYRMDNGAFTGIVNWSTNSLIKPGPNQDNDMLIKAKGGQMQLFANSSLIYEFSDYTYSGGLYGLMIRSDITANFKVFVNQLAYWFIKP
jgi:hypothetical protein